MQFIATIPGSASAVKISGGEGDAIRLMLEANLSGQELADLLNLRGCVLKVSIERE